MIVPDHEIDFGFLYLVIVYIANQKNMAVSPHFVYTNNLDYIITEVTIVIACMHLAN